MEGPLFSIAEASHRTGVAAARVRYYVETYRDFLGLRRDPDGQWKLTADQMDFVAELVGSVTVDGANEPFEWPSTAASNRCGRSAAASGVHQAMGSSYIGDEHLLTLTDRVDDLVVHLE